MHKTFFAHPSLELPIMFSNPRILALTDEMSPKRGAWVVYALNPRQGFVACHEVEDYTKIPRILERLYLSSIADVKQFVQNLAKHGWQRTVR